MKVENEKVSTLNYGSLLTLLSSNVIDKVAMLVILDLSSIIMI